MNGIWTALLAALLLVGCRANAHRYVAPHESAFAQRVGEVVQVTGEAQYRKANWVIATEHGVVYPKGVTIPQMLDGVRVTLTGTLVFVPADLDDRLEIERMGFEIEGMVGRRYSIDRFELRDISSAYVHGFNLSLHPAPVHDALRTEIDNLRLLESEVQN